MAVGLAPEPGAWEARSPGTRVAASPIRGRIGWGWLPGERLVAFLGAFALYLLVAVHLVFDGGFIVPDAWSRVGNASYVIATRDPHLAAIGFVWNPLPSVAMLPFVALRDLWPPLVTAGFAANLVSAFFMAATVATLVAIGRDLGIRRPLRLTLVALFALHPMIVLYGANGMSEAPFLFFLVLAIRSLLSWEATSSTRDLVVLGLALGGAYLTRYEAVAAAAAVIGLIAARTAVRYPGPLRERLEAGLADMVVAGTPFAFVFVGWALASLIIMGNPFETFSSAYGNSSQVGLQSDRIVAVTGRGLAAIAYMLRQQLALAPGVAGLVIGTFLLGLRRRDARAIWPLTIFGGVLGFAALALAGVASFGWLRFSITVIPLATVLALLAASGRPRPDVQIRWTRRASDLHADPSPRDLRPLRWLAALLSMVAFCAAGILGGASFGWVRFAIAVFPMAAVLVLLVGAGRTAAGARAVLVRLPPSEPEPATPTGTRLARGSLRLVTAATLVVILGSGMPTSLAAMTDPRLGREEGAQVRALASGADPTAAALRSARHGAEAARYLDDKGLANGTVLVDVATGFPIVMQSRNRLQFVITTERDFDAALADPLTFGVHYLVVPSSEAAADLDAVNRGYPTLYASGAGFATLVAEFGSGDALNWRLYQVTGHP